MKVAQEILKYLARYPKSGDTLENIVMWWIPAERLHLAREEVQEALAHLIAHGLVGEIVLPGGRQWYQINPDKQSEINQFIRNLSEGKSEPGSIPL